jgi:hypothetical protein
MKRVGNGGSPDFDDLPTNVMHDGRVNALAERARQQSAAQSFDEKETDGRTRVAKRITLIAARTDESGVPTAKWPVLRLVAPVDATIPAEESEAPRRLHKSKLPSLLRGLLAVLAAASVGAGLGAIVPGPPRRSSQAQPTEPALLRLPELMPTTALMWADVLSAPSMTAGTPNAAEAAKPARAVEPPQRPQRRTVPFARYAPSDLPPEEPNQSAGANSLRERRSSP